MFTNVYVVCVLQNLGTIKSSNLCTEIVEYTSPDEVAVCNLASIALNRFVSEGKFDFKALFEVTKVVTRNLNRIIDINYYPVPEVNNSLGYGHTHLTYTHTYTHAGREVQLSS